MPLTAADIRESYCANLNQAPGQICFTMPGGASVCVELDPKVPNVAEQVRKGFAQVNQALTPLKPIFDVIDILVLIGACIEAIPKSLVPPNPKPIIDCIVPLIKKLQDVIALLPPVAIPILAAQIIDALILYLEAYREEILRMVRKSESIERAASKASELGQIELIGLSECAKCNLEIELNNLNAGAEPMNRLIGLINALLGLAGLPCIPSIVGVSELSEEALEPVDKLIKVLLNIRDLIPIPGLDLGEGGSFSASCEESEVSVR